MEEKILTEEFWSPAEISEDVDEVSGEKRMRIIGQVQEADIVNKNNRLYSHEVLESAIEELNKRIGDGRVLGQVDHPDGGIFGGGGPKLKETSHMVKKVWWHEHAGKPTNRLMAEMLIFNTPPGQIIQEIVKGGARPGFSSRGHGKSTPVKMRGYEKEVDKIEKGFVIDAFDFVVDPSVPRARITKIIEQVTGENSAIQEELMDLKELKEKYPQLVEQLSGEISASIAAKAAVPASEPKPAEKPPVENPPAEGDVEVEKEISELHARIEELEEACDTLAKEADLHLEAVAGVVKVLHDNGYIELGNEPAPADQEKESLAAGVADLTEKVKSKDTELTEAKAKVTQLTAEVAQAKLDLHIVERTSGKKFGALMRKRLSECKSIEEVDEKLKSEDAFIQMLLSEEAKVLGKGRQEIIPAVDADSQEEAAVKEQAKGMAGISKKQEKKEV